ncbi:hypothetical protein FA15DRAFT_656220 [Coprinopsis marcescibilis]|uniref:Uncharacterized protein n=1 Tax=Coprinopsis marcescibilis TaxID=230819 RepID=A0A5C3KU83_COPMA|nr:hypothetical protein FA15DRAFT_656220 [Coprinopsis marcescibilis]
MIEMTLSKVKSDNEFTVGGIPADKSRFTPGTAVEDDQRPICANFTFALAPIPNDRAMVDMVLWLIYHKHVNLPLDAGTALSDEPQPDAEYGIGNGEAEQLGTIDGVGDEIETKDRRTGKANSRRRACLTKAKRRTCTKHDITPVRALPTDEILNYWVYFSQKFPRKTPKDMAKLIGKMRNMRRPQFFKKPMGVMAAIPGAYWPTNRPLVIFYGGSGRKLTYRSTHNIFNAGAWTGLDIPGGIQSDYGEDAVGNTTVKTIYDTDRFPAPTDEYSPSHNGYRVYAVCT